MATDDLGNQRVAFEWGNVPMQPNNDRTDDYIYTDEDNNYSVKYIGPELGASGNHVVNGTEWNKFPAFKGSRNYMVTDAEYLGENSYQYTAENDLKVGDYVTVSNAGGFSFTNSQPVIYADHTKFIIENELGTGAKLTGLLARVDVREPGEVGNTLEGGDAFYWPSNVGICYNSYNPRSPEGRWPALIEYLRTAGVNPAFLKEATFTGGEDQYDWQEGEYDEANPGIIFWSYIPADMIFWIDWETGTVYTGKDFDGLVVGAANSWGSEVAVDGDPSDYFFTAFTNDPAKNNTAGWL